MAKMRLVVNTTALAVLVVLLAAVAANAEGVLLRYKFAPQQELAYDLWMVGTGGMNIAGLSPAPEQGEMPGKLQMQLEANASFSLLVTAVDEQGNGTLGLGMGPLAMQIQAMGRSFHMAMDLTKGTVEVDGKSIQIPAGPMQQVLPSFENLRWTISPRGKLVAISGLPELLTGGGAMPQMPMLANMADLQELLKEIPGWFPEDPVTVGDSWDMQIALPLPGMGADPLPEFAIKYTLERLGEIGGHRIARIGFEGVLEGANLAIPMPAGPAQQQREAAEDMNMALTETVDGQIYLDLDAGQMHSARGNVAIDVSMGVPLPAQVGEEASGPGAMSMQMAMKLHFVVWPAR